MPVDYSSQLEKVGTFSSFEGDGRVVGVFSARNFAKACDALAKAIENSPIRKAMTLLMAPMGKTFVQQYTTGIPSLDMDEQYDTIRYSVFKWFNEILPNHYLYFFWMGRFTAKFLGRDWDLIWLIRNEVFGFEPVFSLRKILGSEEFEKLVKPLRVQTAAFYKALDYHEQSWLNVPPGSEVKWNGKVVTVWDLYNIAFDGLVDAFLPLHVLNHPQVVDAVYYEQVQPVIFDDVGGE